MAVTATGTTREITDKEKDPLAEAYLEKHPHLEDFVKSPGCALVRMDVDCYYTVRQFQKVTELHIRR
jgi:hypothetical protein